MDDIKEFALFMTLSLFVSLFAGAAFISTEGRKRTRTLLAVLLRAGIAGLFLSLLTLYRGLLGNALAYLSPLFSAHWFRFVLLPACIATSMALYRLRTTKRRIYAGLEFAVGLFSAWLAISPLQAGGRIQPPQDADRLMKIVAAVYLMIRAMDNWNRASDIPRAGPSWGLKSPTAP